MASRTFIIAVISVAVAVAAGMSLYYTQALTSPPADREQESTVNSDTNSAIVIPSPYAKEFQLPKDSWPNGIVVDSKGSVWTVGSRSQSLISFSSNGIKSFVLPGSDETSSIMVWTMIADDKDGSIFFSGSAQNPVLRFDPKTEVFQVIGTPSAPPMQMEAGKGGNIWYTLQGGAIGALQELGRSGSHIYDVQELGTGEDSFPSGIFLQNQLLWITQTLAGKIVLFNITYGGEDGRNIQDIEKAGEFPQQGALFTPTDIIMNNGSAWVTEHGTSFLTEYNFETQQLKRYPTALHPIQISTLPYWLAEDPDGNGVWFNEHRGNRIAFFDFSSRTLTEYEVPTRNPQMGYIANVLTLAADPTNTNRVWFTEFTEDKIGYVDKSIPIPFDIRTSDKQIVLEDSQTAQIDIEVTRNPDVPVFNNTLSFNASSSAVISGVLLNATANFSPNSIDLSKVSGTRMVTLELMNKGITKGTHMLAVSATDGAVVRTVYVELEVR